LLSVTLHNNFIVHIKYFRIVLKFRAAFGEKGVVREGFFEVRVKKLSGEICVIAFRLEIE
jgi:hypothetical protein